MKGLPTGLVLLAILIAWWLLHASTAGASQASKAPEERVVKELEIDANVMSPTFGLPCDQISGGC